MKKIIIGVVIVAVGVVLGYQGALMKVVKSEYANNTMDHTMSAMTGALVQVSGDALDKAFLELMIVHHEGAIVMAKQVLAETKRTELKEMAEGIITAQQSEIDMMRTWLDEWFTTDVSADKDSMTSKSMAEEVMTHDNF